MGKDSIQNFAEQLKNFLNFTNDQGSVSICIKRSYAQSQKQFKRNKKFKAQIYKQRQEDIQQNPDKQYNVLFRTKVTGMKKFKQSTQETGLEAIEADNMLNTLSKKIFKRKNDQQEKKKSTPKDWNSKRSKKAKERSKTYKKWKKDKKQKLKNEKLQQIKDKYAIKEKQVIVSPVKSSMNEEKKT